MYQEKIEKLLDGDGFPDFTAIMELLDCNPGLVADFVRYDINRFVNKMDDMDKSEVRRFFYNRKELLSQPCADGETVMYHLLRNGIFTARDMLADVSLFKLFYEKGQTNMNLAHKMYITGLLSAYDLITDTGCCKKLLMSKDEYGSSLIGKMSSTMDYWKVRKAHEIKVVDDEMYYSESRTGFDEKYTINSIIQKREAFDEMIYGTSESQKKKMDCHNRIPLGGLDISTSK